MSEIKTSSAVVIAGYLKQNPLLAVFSQDNLIEIALNSEQFAYAPGEIIYREGDQGDTLLCITDGECDIIKADKVIARRGKGDIVGEMALLENRPRFATVQAGDFGLEGLLIPFEAFFGDAGEYELRSMLAVMSRKLREAQEARLGEVKRQRDELGELASLQAAFLGMVRHELVTPVSNAQMSLEVIRRWYIEDLSDELRQQLDVTEHAVEAARKKMVTLVEYAGLIGRQGTMNIQPVDFSMLVETAVFATRSRVEAKGLDLRYDSKIDTLILNGDRRRIGEAIAHLLDNAIKYTSRGGEITVELWNDSDFVYVQVSDTGIGIPADKLESLWEPFRQMVDAYHRGVEGLGLGLALVKFTAKAHGGDVWAASRVGEGSRFGFKIPVATA